MTERAAPAAVCNIGPKQSRLRRNVGIVAMIAGLGTWFAMRHFGVPDPYRLVLFPIFFFAGLGIFQAQAGVCVANARSGIRNMDTGNEPVADPEADAALKRAARSVYLRAAVFAAVLTLVAFFWPA